MRLQVALILFSQVKRARVELNICVLDGSCGIRGKEQEEVLGIGRGEVPVLSEWNSSSDIIWRPLFADEWLRVDGMTQYVFTTSSNLRLVRQF